jgi:hypothetical protein
LRRTTLAEPSAEGAAAWPTTDGRVLYGRRDDDRFVLWSPGVATFAFARSGPVEYDTVDEDDAGRLWTRSALPLAVEARGLPVLHASALSEGDACVVVCGRSTAGKSTLAAVAGKSGLEVESDDAIAFLPRDDGVLARTLPFEVRLRPTAEKAIGPVAFRGDGGRELHLRHVVLLEPDGEATEVEREEISPAEAFASLMPHAYCFSLADSNDRIVDEYTTLVERVPVSRLRYEPRHESLAATVDAVRSVLA